MSSAKETVELAVERSVRPSPSTRPDEDRHDVEVLPVDRQVLDQVSPDATQPSFLLVSELVVLHDPATAASTRCCAVISGVLFVSRMLDHRDDVGQCDLVSELVGLLEVLGREPLRGAPKLLAKLAKRIRSPFAGPIQQDF